MPRNPNNGTAPAMTKVCGPMRLETTGASYTYKLDPRCGYGKFVDVLFMIRVLKVNATGTTTLKLFVKHSPDGDSTTAAHYDTPIDTTVTSEPTLLVGDTDAATNGRFGEWLHLQVEVGGGAGEWADIELFELGKAV